MVRKVPTDQFAERQLALAAAPVQIGPQQRQQWQREQRNAQSIGPAARPQQPHAHPQCADRLDEKRRHCLLADHVEQRAELSALLLVVPGVEPGAAKARLVQFTAQHSHHGRLAHAPGRGDRQREVRVGVAVAHEVRQRQHRRAVAEAVVVQVGEWSVGEQGRQHLGCA